MQRILLIINQVVQVEWASSQGGSHWLTERKMEEKPKRGQTFGSQNQRKRLMVKVSELEPFGTNMRWGTTMGLRWSRCEGHWGQQGQGMRKQWCWRHCFIAAEVSCDDGKSEMKGKTLSQDQSPVNGGKGKQQIKAGVSLQGESSMIGEGATEVWKQQWGTTRELAHSYEPPRVMGSCRITMRLVSLFLNTLEVFHNKKLVENGFWWDKTNRKIF